MDEEAASHATGLLDLPNETILTITSYLDKLDLAQFRLVCRRTSPLGATLLFRSITTSFVTLPTLLQIAASSLGEYVEELVFLEVPSLYGVHRHTMPPTRDTERIWKLVNMIRSHYGLDDHGERPSPLEEEDWPVSDESEDSASPKLYWKPDIGSHGKSSISS